jgi:uncharacterized membrane protein YcaP (DUF421 family)
MIAISAAGIYFALILLTRIAGLRSFSKMSSFDFAITVAIGSIIASTVLSKNPPLLQAAFALATLYALQISVAKLRGVSKSFKNAIGNKPLLLMRGKDILFENLQQGKVTHDDLRAKLREANVTQMSQVKAVIMESTGDISVLHHNDPTHKVDSELLKGVLGWEE